MKVCPECDGEGEVMMDHEWAAGLRSELEAMCGECDGTGEVEHDPDDPYDVDGGVYPLSVVDTRPR